MSTFAKIRHMVAKAGVQTFNLGVAYALTSVTVNGSAATTTTANRVVTITSPTLAGGEAVVITESLVQPTVPAPAPMPIVTPTGSAIALVRNGVSQSWAGLPDVTTADPAYTPSLTKANH